MMLPITWYDGIEILFFSSLFYYLSLWLRKDRQKNLLWVFYGYCAVTLLAYNLNLPTMSLFLLLFSPAIIMLFIMVHQETLQRNFVALRHTIPAQAANHDWLEALIQTCLITINNNKTITCIIERNDSMHTFLHVPFVIHAPLQTALLEILVNCSSYDQHKMVWIDAQGNLEGINATWRHEIVQNPDYMQGSLTKTLSEKMSLENALAYTTKTDALIITITPETRTFTLIMQGNMSQKINARHAYATIKKYLAVMHTNNHQTKGKLYGTNSKKDTDQQCAT